MRAVALNFLWFYSVCSYYVAPGVNFQGQSMGEKDVFGRNYHCKNFALESINCLSAIHKFQQ